MSMHLSNVDHLKRASENGLSNLLLTNSAMSLDDAITTHHIRKRLFNDNIEGTSNNNDTSNNHSFGQAIHNSLNEVFIFDAKTYKFLDVNKGAVLNIGYSLSELRQLTPFDIKPEFDSSTFKELITPLQNNTKNKIIFTTVHQRKDHSTYPTEIHLQLLFYNNKPAFIAISLDVTEQRQQQKVLESLAYYDGLTGLANRTLFSDRLHQMIARSKRDKSMLAVCFLDLDNFKPINDNFGHQVGDKLLMEVAKRIQSEIREGDTASRLGGDEFTLLLGDITTLSHCKNMLERIHDSLSQPYLIDGHSLKISASSGVTVYPLDDSDTYDLVCHADNAMYQAKRSGKNQFNFFSLMDEHHETRK